MNIVLAKLDNKIYATTSNDLSKKINQLQEQIKQLTEQLSKLTYNINNINFLFRSHLPMYRRLQKSTSITYMITIPHYAL